MTESTTPRKAREIRQAPQENSGKKEKNICTEMYPYGKSMYPSIMAADSCSTLVQVVCLTVTTVICGLVLPILTSLVAVSFQLDASWDERHGCGWSFSDFADLQKLLVVKDCVIEQTCGIPSQQLMNVMVVCVSCYVLLLAADWSGMKWPFDTSNNLCYNEMFSEPGRASLVARVGNTYSNILFLFGGLCVLLAVPSVLFWVSDAMFGIMLVLLAIFSTLWHSTNAAWTQYPDLWAMEACIIYLILRCACTGLFVIGTKFLSPTALLPPLPSICCLVSALAYAGILIKIGKTQFSHYMSGKFDEVCPFSARIRMYYCLANPTDPARTTHVLPRKVTTLEVCAFLGMPVIYMIIPTVLLYTLESVGSVFCSTCMCTSLAIGWSVRMFDRWVMDGWWPMNLVTANLDDTDTDNSGDKATKRAKSGLVTTFWLTVGALFSPTALLHWYTGITLVFGYAHVRSLDPM